MIVKYCVWLLLCFCSVLQADELNNIPVSFQGRFLPAEEFAKQWLYDVYHHSSIKNKDLGAFNLPSNSALDFIVQLHFFGHRKFDESPLFWIRQSKLKEWLGLPTREDRFSYNDLKQINENVPLLQKIVIYHFVKAYQDPSNYSGRKRLELTQLSPGLWLEAMNNTLKVIEISQTSPWQALKPGMIISNGLDLTVLPSDKSIMDDALALMNKLRQYEALQGSDLAAEQELSNIYLKLLNEKRSSQQIGHELEQRYPLKNRFQNAGLLLKALPSKRSPGEWYSLHALQIKEFDPDTRTLEPAANFTLYSDELFEKIRHVYLRLIQAENNLSDSAALKTELATLLLQGYHTIAATVYQNASGKQLTYPSINQLKAESFYGRYPLILICIAGYAIALLMLILGGQLQKAGFITAGAIVLTTTFFLHGGILLLRSYILGRPPVSNMFETLLYVPWIGVLTSLLLFLKYRSSLLMGAAATGALALLLLLQITQIDSSFTNVQAVLDSQYWLIVHVLLVVGSYGIFILCGLLGHLYLGILYFQGPNAPPLRFLANFILQTMYLGVGMLVPGTLLGGIWAAESWGRFWDWDPKESWAFISICVYIIWIHAYRFHRIGDIGLAIGSVTGMLAIGFTWYGVNYILGTGLHSYGFGQGGEGYYYSYVIAEIIFISLVIWGTASQKKVVK
jgi:ABC-type transport system involved in cytochrome c biogenesis permease subunit